MDILIPLLQLISLAKANMFHVLHASFLLLAIPRGNKITIIAIIFKMIYYKWASFELGDGRMHHQILER